MSLEKTERSAMLLDRQAVLVIVSALRKYREASKVLLDSRYRDGEVDAVALHTFQSAISEIEEDGGDDS